VGALRESQEDVEEMVKELAVRRDLACEILEKIEGMKFYCPQGTFYVFADVSGVGGYDGDKFADVCLRKAGVVMCPGGVFGSEGKDFVRVCFAVDKEDLVFGLRKVLELFAS
jgi:aspartate/methionine/tyrosine aminotransferase